MCSSRLPLFLLLQRSKSQGFCHLSSEELRSPPPLFCSTPFQLKICTKGFGFGEVQSSMMYQGGKRQATRQITSWAAKCMS